MQGGDARKARTHETETGLRMRIEKFY